MKFRVQRGRGLEHKWEERKDVGDHEGGNRVGGGACGLCACPLQQTPEWAPASCHAPALGLETEKFSD